MNIFEYCHPDNNYNNDSFGSFLSKNRIFCSVNLHFMKVSTEIDNNFGYEKITQLVDNKFEHTDEVDDKKHASFFLNYK